MTPLCFPLKYLLQSLMVYATRNQTKFLTCLNRKMIQFHQEWSEKLLRRLLVRKVASSPTKPTGAEQSRALQSDCVAGVLELQREVDEFADSERELRDVDELECDFD